VRVILIAAKELKFAKTRLQSGYGEESRRRLAEAMFRDVLNASLTARNRDHVAVVSSDPLLLAIAREAGAIAIDEEWPRGLNAAVELATRALCSEGATTVCTVLSDIPLVTGSDIDSAISATPARGGVVLAPSHERTGTNIIVRSPGYAIPTRFGNSSLAQHLEECRKRDLEWEVLPLVRAALDLDVPGDLREFVRLGGAPHTSGELSRLGLHG